MSDLILVLLILVSEVNVANIVETSTILSSKLRLLLTKSILGLVLTVESWLLVNVKGPLIIASLPKVELTLIKESVKDVRRKTLSEKYEAKVKAAQAQKGKKK
mgnify:CR=1 FL=1